MATRKVKTFAEALDVLNDDVSALNDAIDNAVAGALQQYGTSASRDARTALNRPRWLLSRSISPKIVQYRRTGKTVAIVGAERTTTSRPRKGVPDPGVYAGFFESGTNGNVPAHFLRRGKVANVASIPENLARTFDAEVARIASGQKPSDVNIRKV